MEIADALADLVEQAGGAQGRARWVGGHGAHGGKGARGARGGELGLGIRLQGGGGVTELTGRLRMG